MYFPTLLVKKRKKVKIPFQGGRGLFLRVNSWVVSADTGTQELLRKNQGKMVLLRGRRGKIAEKFQNSSIFKGGSRSFLYQTSRLPPLKKVSF